MNPPTCLQTTVYGVHLCTMCVILSTVKMQVKFPCLHIEACGGMEVFLNLALYGGEWSASHLGCFIPMEKPRYQLNWRILKYICNLKMGDSSQGDFVHVTRFLCPNCGTHSF